MTMVNAWGSDPRGFSGNRDKKVEREPPRPLTREIEPAMPFPDEALGAVLGNAARAINDKIQAPMAIGAQSVLATASLAVQAHANVVLPTEQKRPLSRYLIMIADTGERKTSCDQEAIWPIERHEENLRKKYGPDERSYVNDKLAWDKCREAALKLGSNATADRVAMKAALDALGPAPEPPFTPILTCDEPTFEGLAKVFATGHPSLGVFSAEGGQFVGGYGMSDEAKLRTAAGLSKVWDGAMIKRVRSGDGNLILPGKRLSLHLMMQPVVAEGLFRDELLSGQGLLSRLLTCVPDTASGTRLYKKPLPESDAALNRYGARILDIFEMAAPTKNRNQVDPRDLPLSGTATNQWIIFADRVEQRLAPRAKFSEIRGLANKLGEHAGRIAGVLALIENIEAIQIESRHLDAAILLAEHYAAEADRLLGAARVRKELQIARRLLDWLQSEWPLGVVSLPDIYRNLRAIPDAKSARKHVTILEAHGWVERIPEGATIDNLHRREAWRIITFEGGEKPDE
jgi:hypothetical protein